MAQWLRSFGALAENLSSTSSTYIALTAVYNSTPVDWTPSSHLCGSPGTYVVHIHTCGPFVHIHKLIKISLKICI